MANSEDSNKTSGIELRQSHHPNHKGLKNYINHPNEVNKYNGNERVATPQSHRKFQNVYRKVGYGWVYKEVLPVSRNDIVVAVKRLNEQFGQGLKEFLTEIHLLSGQQHLNLISFLGYCDEGYEKIIVYEYTERGSLNRYIRRNRDATCARLTWLERLKVCVGAARGLDHLHNHVGGHRTIVHRDIKSSNILTDWNGVAKISDLGLSKLIMMGFVLCGRLCISECNDGFILSGQLVRVEYKNKNVVKIIDPTIKGHFGSDSMTNFSAIAYRSLQDDREIRLTMDVVRKELEEMLEFQPTYAQMEATQPKHLLNL
ncbi:serine/threonine/dual specificity protein kinase, catalytic domain-containing protein [Artemisia annua]|uniref:Serine/threonine/dual specificity protein kinase, catalytic domain-containing protein n=1 Tax=Artemisia annua TaxID=35608 RepID=A0A2U1QBF9_ARTAN|nr:serine/threonine/dual specificity protein kinase, catalytic domain-containing protein [Artemisia annua]